ncbi:hypothetical protein [Microbulbifer halophilus]|uniref:Uncharacterized protein n=1 Tax=Microbulbifer halophilus TaxID=453963 RepID=A0ABW5EAZ2_9GAMM|nr:hypothetical protein [Microbulbifer halophilus]MCW8127924.1 hypothetical protein [Microbulbifer halophilus]
MLKISLLACAFLLSGTACAQESSMACPYSDKVEYDLELPVSGRLVSEGRERDEDSGEYIVKREVSLDNGDSVYIEQKYCSMYNLTVVYRLSEVKEFGFAKGLDVIHSIIKGVDQDYSLKSPLGGIVKMTMNQRRLTLSDSFEYGLPLQAARSSENVEHTIGFELLPDSSDFPAEIQFYLGVGGL